MVHVHRGWLRWNKDRDRRCQSSLECVELGFPHRMNPPLAQDKIRKGGMRSRKDSKQILARCKSASADESAVTLNHSL